MPISKNHHDDGESSDEDEKLLSLTSTPTPAKPPTVSNESQPKFTIESLTSEKAIAKAQRVKDQQLQRGICHITRVPPGMGPKRIRLILGQFGDIDRIYLEPEDGSTTARRRRRQGGDHGGRRYTQGWIEFLDKRKAKKCALMLNGQSLGKALAGGKKAQEDFITLQYLSKVTWDQLYHAHQHNQQVKLAVLTKSIEEGKKATTSYLDNVSDAKRQQQIDAKIAERHRKRLASTNIDDIIGEDASQMSETTSKSNSDGNNPINTVKKPKFRTLE